jgi:hypothetical protein
MTSRVQRQNSSGQAGKYGMPVIPAGPLNRVNKSFFNLSSLPFVFEKGRSISLSVPRPFSFFRYIPRRACGIRKEAFMMR